MMATSITLSAGVGNDISKITGTGFTNATRVFWRGAKIPSHMNTNTEMLVLLPMIDSGTDLSGPLTLRREDNAQVDTAASLTVQALPKPKSLSVASANEGDVVRIDGKYLTSTLIKSIVMGDKEFLPTSQNVVVQRAEGRAERIGGVARLEGHKVSAGVLNVIPPTPSIEISSVQVSQELLYTVSNPVADPNFRIVGQRDLLVRVRLKPAESLGQIKPDVQIGFRNDAKIVPAPAYMSGPAPLGMSAVKENDLDNSYTYTIPANGLTRDSVF